MQNRPESCARLFPATLLQQGSESARTLSLQLPEPADLVGTMALTDWVELHPASECFEKTCA